MPVVVDVADGDSMTIAFRQRSDLGAGGDIFERSVAPVPEEAVTGSLRCLARGERTSLDRIDVKPAIPVEVEQPHAPAHGLGELMVLGAAAFECEGEPRLQGIIAEVWRFARRRPGRRWLGTPDGPMSAARISRRVRPVPANWPPRAREPEESRLGLAVIRRTLRPSVHRANDSNR